MEEISQVKSRVQTGVLKSVDCARSREPPTPPKFNVDALATRGPPALAIIYVVGQGLNFRGNIEIWGPGVSRAWTRRARWLGADLDFTCDISSLNSSLRRAASPLKGAWALGRIPSRSQATPAEALGGGAKSCVSRAFAHLIRCRNGPGCGLGRKGRDGGGRRQAKGTREAGGQANGRVDKWAGGRTRKGGRWRAVTGGGGRWRAVEGGGRRWRAVEGGGGRWRAVAGAAAGVGGRVNARGQKLAGGLGVRASLGGN